MPAISTTLSNLASAQDSNLSVQSTAFNILVLLALTLNAAYLAPALWSSSIHRRPQWYSLAISYIVYSTSYLLIIGHQSGPDPPYGLCLAQAAFIYAAPPLSMVTGALVFITVPVVLVIEGYTAMILYRNWGAFRQSSLMKPNLSLSMFLRLAAFTAVAFVVAGIDMTAMYVVDDATSAWSIVLTIDTAKYPYYLPSLSGRNA
ncbi:hypothetical protein DXG01_006228 [Tephrocybe rancida]|nr:hypothetical protein DXG01_006228 [Tephrocybe rancida]